jgi:putative membrane protein
METYLILKALHIISVIAWMAGLLYLPRVFVYHSLEKTNSTTSTTFCIMERRLFNFIMNPSLIFTWGTGMILVFEIGFNNLWLILKLFLVILMTCAHIFYGYCVAQFRKESNKFSSKFYKIANEIPTILMILIVFLVVIQPFS